MGLKCSLFFASRVLSYPPSGGRSAQTTFYFPGPTWASLCWVLALQAWNQPRTRRLLMGTSSSISSRSEGHHILSEKREFLADEPRSREEFVANWHCPASKTPRKCHHSSHNSQSQNSSINVDLVFLLASYTASKGPRQESSQTKPVYGQHLSAPRNSSSLES